MSSLGFADPSTLTSCTPSTCPIDTSFYNYRLSLPANAALLALFALCALAYATAWLRTRRAPVFAAAMLLGCAAEILGYAARVWSWRDQWDETAYLMQIICLTLAPALFSAGVYVCLGAVVRVCGEGCSRLRARTYSVVFIPCDVVALLLQAIGGGMSASALAEEDLATFQTGNDILTAGLAWQVFTLFCFLGLCADFAWRVHRAGSAAASSDPRAAAIRESSGFKAFVIALGLASVLIFWRCVYRVVELNAGFTGPVTYDQGLFIGFEGVLIVVAAVVLAAAHPAWCLEDGMGSANGGIGEEQAAAPTAIIPNENIQAEENEKETNE